MPQIPDPKRPAPFATLLGAGSMVLAVLLVAGFSYRWAYYYNFGLKDLAIQVPAQSIALGALELIRTPEDAWNTLLLVGLPMVLLSLAIAFVQGLEVPDPPARRKPWHLLAALVRSSQLGVDIVRAIVLIYAAYWAGSEAGVRKFTTHVVESPGNALPKVTVVPSGKSQEGSFPIACTPADWSGSSPARAAVPPVVGAPSAVEAFREGLACNAPGSRSWRLLYRDDRFIYLFATGKAEARPTTLILPSSDAFVVILQGTGTP